MTFPRPSRTGLLVLALIGAGGAVACRLVQLTVVAHPTLAALARNQNEDVVRIPGPRGDIVDRHGRRLATSVPVQVLAAVPRRLSAGALAALERAAGTPGRLSSRRDRSWVLVRRDCDPATVAAVEALVEAGRVPRDAVHWAPGFRREYPHGALAAHVLGFVSLDESLAEGIEKARDDLLRSGETHVMRSTDARGEGIGSSAAPFPASASTLMLTLDLRVQERLEAALERARVEHRARAAQGIVLDPATGEVLALANVPAYDPNRYGAAPASLRRNAAIEFPYEPGSVMKPLSAAALAQYGLVGDGERVFCENGIWRRGRWPLRDTHPYGMLSLADVVAVSSNIGMVKFAQRCSPERMHGVLSGLGLGRATGIELPAENRGRLPDWRTWRPTDRDGIAYGHALTVTTLQLAAAYGVIANGGVRVTPRIVRAWGEPGGRWHDVPAAEGKRVLDAGAAGKVALYMLGVVEAERATGHLAAIPGYRVAGKTGTAEKIVNGRYDPRRNIATFAGFAPLRAPVGVVVISLDEPAAGVHTGGVVAAPAFSEVMAELLRLRRVVPDYLPEPPAQPAEAAATLREPAPRPVAHARRRG